MTEQYVLLWSQRQNALHVETMAEHTTLNRAACATNRPGDYRLLLAGTRAQVDAELAKVRPLLLKRGLTMGKVAA